MQMSPRGLQPPLSPWQRPIRRRQTDKRTSTHTRAEEEDGLLGGEDGDTGLRARARCRKRRANDAIGRGCDDLTIGGRLQLDDLAFTPFEDFPSSPCSSYSSSHHATPPPSLSLSLSPGAMFGCRRIIGLTAARPTLCVASATAHARTHVSTNQSNHVTLFLTVRYNGATIYRPSRLFTSYSRLFGVTQMLRLRLCLRLCFKYKRILLQILDGCCSA